MHIEYPHKPGRSFDCAACTTGPCVCNPESDAPCVSDFCEQVCQECGGAPCECKPVPGHCPNPAFHSSPVHVCVQAEQDERESCSDDLDCTCIYCIPGA